MVNSSIAWREFGDRLYLISTRFWLIVMALEVNITQIPSIIGDNSSNGSVVCSVSVVLEVAVGRLGVVVGRGVQGTHGVFNHTMRWWKHHQVLVLAEPFSFTKGRLVRGISILGSYRDRQIDEVNFIYLYEFTGFRWKFRMPIKLHIV